MAFSFAPQLAFLAGPLEAISAGRQYSSFGHRQLYDDYNRTKEGAIAVEYIVLDMEWNLNFFTANFYFFLIWM